MALKFLTRSRGEKAVAGTSFWSHISPGAATRIMLRLFQFVMGITTIGLYAHDLNNARKAGVYIDSKWVWAVVCGSLGSIVATIFMTPLVKAWFFFYVDAFVFLCYLIASGIFGKMYIPENAEGNAGITRMKNAVWVLLTNMFLWCGTACYGAVVFWKTRKARTSLTGRGAQHALVLEIDLEIGRWLCIGQRKSAPEPIAEPKLEELARPASPAVTTHTRVSFLPIRHPSPTRLVNQPETPVLPPPNLRITSHTRLQPYPNQDHRSLSAPPTLPPYVSWQMRDGE